MTPFSSAVGHNTITHIHHNNSHSSTGHAESSDFVEHNPYALVLALIPLLTIFGNALVILAVRKDKSLQTVTNLLIVSLASADLLVALCVMFFAVYFEWNSFIWDLGPTLCNLYIGADVACSTASILNLLAISIDRYIAISHPLTYCQIGTNSRAYLFIALVWGISISVAIPVAFGANHIEREHECAFTNPLFMIGSSLFSFFLPCLAMIALYAVVFRRLREREHARAARKRNAAMSGVESALITNALMGGAKMARQIARSHLKDQLLLELSLQTSSFPTGSPSEGEEDEEEEYDDAFESEGSSRRRSKRAHLHNASPAMPPRRPTFCLMMNGDMPFPMAPMNPLQLPMTSLRNEAERRVKGWRRKRTLRLLRRCNTLPTAVLRHKMASLPPESDACQCGKVPEKSPEKCLPESGKEEDEEAAELLTEVTKTGCKSPNSSLACDLHEETRSFGDELEERLFPFIDRSLSVASSLVSAAVRKWSQTSAGSEKRFYDAEKQLRERAESGMAPIRHNSYAGWQQASGECCRRPSSAQPTPVIRLVKTDDNNNDRDPIMQKPHRTDLHGNSDNSNLLPGLLQLGSNLSLPNLMNTPTPSRKSIAGGEGFNHYDTEADHAEVAEVSRKRSEGIRNGGLKPIRKSSGGRMAKQASLLVRLVRWTIGAKRKSRGRRKSAPEAGSRMDGVVESAHASLVGERPSAATTVVADPRSNSVGASSRSVRITRTLPERPLPSDGTALRNGSCPLVKLDNGGQPQKKLSSTSTAFSSSPLRYIRQAFRRSLVPIIEEGRRPSRQLLKRATRQMRREQKATVTLAIVLAVFLCCWVPFFALHLSNAICLLSGGSQCVHLLAMFLSTWLGYLNSSLNPLIYTVFDKRFRKAFRNLLGCAESAGVPNRRGTTARTVMAGGGSSDGRMGPRAGPARRTIR